MVPLPRTQPDLHRSRDFLAGLLFFVFGVLALCVARAYPMGISARLGLAIDQPRIFDRPGVEMVCNACAGTAATPACCERIIK